MKKSVIIAVIVVVAVVVAGGAAWLFLSRPPTPVTPPTPPTPPGPIVPTGKATWRIATCGVGSIGYIAHVATADIINRQYPEWFSISVTVAGCAAAGHAAWDAGRAEMGYTALNIVYQYMTRTGRWAPGIATPKRAGEMSVIMYQYPLIYTIFVTEDLAGKVKCWKDIKDVGAGIFPTPVPYASHEVFKEVFSILYDVDPEDLYKVLRLEIMDVGGVGDAITLGRVKIVWGYGDPGGPASWVAESFAKVGYRLVAVPPSPEELSLLLARSGSLVPFTMNLTPYNVKTADGKTLIDVVAVPFGFVGSSRELSKEHVYYFFKTHFTNATAFEKALATFTGFSKWGLDFNIKAFQVQSKYGAPIHPGVALYLRELGYNLEELGILVAGS